MFLKAQRFRTLSLTGVSLCLVACGARGRGNDPPDHDEVPLAPTVLDEQGQVLRRCHSDAGCLSEDRCRPFGCRDGVCEALPPVQCDDLADVCLANSCEPSTGVCKPVQRTDDEDGDGFFAALPGKQPGTDGACGDDCDDHRADSSPVGMEVCDGQDNDCDGVVDEGFSFSGPSDAPILITEGAKEGSVGGLIHNGELFVLSYSQRNEKNETLLRGMRAGNDVEFQTEVALTNSDSYAGPLNWSPSRLVTVWEDRRDDDFEIYFNRFDDEGNKLGSDVRLSTADDFSLNPTLLSFGRETLVFWQDRRDAFLNFQIYGQRVSYEGELVGDNIDLTMDFVDAEAPSVAQGVEQLALVFNAPIDGRQVVFRTVSFDLAVLGPPVVVSQANSVGASVSFNDGRYFVLWHEYDGFPGDAIWGAVLDPSGEILVAPRRVTDPAPFARGHRVLPMGDRLLLLWAEYVDDSYDVFLRTLNTELEPIDEAIRITESAGDVLGGAAAIGNGKMGVAYSSFESGSPQVYFVTLTCQ